MSHKGMHGDALNSSGAHWRDAETRLLIKLWRQPRTLAEVNDSSSRQKSVYQRLAKILVAAGYFRDAGQIKNKIRTMTTNFRRFSKMRSEDRSSWTGQGKQSFQYFNELREFVDVEISGEASKYDDDDGDSSISVPGEQQNAQVAVVGRGEITGCLQVQRIKLEDNHQQVPALPSSSSVLFDTSSSNLTNSMNDGAALLLNQSDTSDHQLHQLPNGNFDADDSQEIVDSQEAEVGWISDEDEIVEPRTKVRCHIDLSNNQHNSKRASRRSLKKDDSVKELVKILIENNMQRDKVFMEAEDAHRRMEAERHTEEIRLLRDQIQLERDRLQFEREERERMELVRREEAARAERLRREEMERSEKVRLDERDREERRFTLMMALIKGAQNHGS
ncbi:reticulocyte-binding protein 2 homolog a-like isoform X2 [Lytechinus variegatus]|uniref:reticulocyte-binding protein 2 homolog a-like isoform X2 n=1 Tax=Lytechinus variegatus TaxID=7654 RepID=UPI001BB24260|nr:reticulocyte-binding protein 2 homolog a-like isoform X2 [Lytechinus variegatus]